jgi:hypothetical protein
MASLLRKIQPALAVFLLLAVVSVASYADAASPNLTVGLNNVVPNIGKVAAGTSSTNFTVDPSGAISVGTGGGDLIPHGAVRSSQQVITVSCATGANCNKNNITVAISATGGTNRLGTLNGLAVTMGTAQLASGSPSSCVSCGGLTITLKPVAGAGQTSGSATFNLGMTVPVTTSGTLGSAVSNYSVQASGSGYNASTVATAALQATVEGRLSISKSSNLSYGTLVLNAGQSGTATWDASHQTFSLSPSNVAVQIHSGPTLGTFAVSGTPGQQLNFNVPATIKMFNAANQEVDITVATTGQGVQSIPITGTFTFYVGGSINLSSAMHTGAYSAVFAVTANYQ